MYVAMEYKHPVMTFSAKLHVADDLRCITTRLCGGEMVRLVFKFLLGSFHVVRNALFTLSP